MIEGQQIVGVRDLTPEEASILGRFPSGVDTIPGLELEEGEVIFIGGDEEGNHPGEWPLTREKLESLVGKYVVGFRGPADYDGVHANRPPVVMDVADEPPTIEDGEIVATPNERTEIEPVGRGVGPSAWFIREENDSDADPDETPTADEVFEMLDDGEIDADELNELLHEAERAHSDALFSSIC